MLGHSVIAPTPSVCSRLTTLAVVLFLFVGAPPPTAHAADPAAAVELFEQGEDAMARGKYEQACASFEQAWKLARAGRPLKRWAECETARGRFVLALELYAQLREFATDDASRSVIDEAAADLRTKVGQLRIERLPGAPADLSVDVDGQVVTEDTLLLDPGPHRVRVTGADAPTQFEEIHIKPGQDAVIRVPLDGESGAPAPAAGAPPTPDEPSDGLSNVQVAGVVVLGVGVAAGVGAAITGVMILDRKATADDGCDANRANCNEEARAAADSGESLLIPNAILFGVAAVGVLGGVALLVFGGDDQPEEAAVVVSPSSIQLRGVF